jgi:hypothetical protein
LLTGQGVCQFAREIFTQREVAIKFCVIPSVFDAERSLYSNPALRSIVPNISEICDNTDSTAIDPAGYPLPPCIVMEKGESLDVWSARAKPDVFSAVQVGFILSHIVSLRARLRAVSSTYGAVIGSAGRADWNCDIFFGTACILRGLWTSGHIAVQFHSLLPATLTA